MSLVATLMQPLRQSYKENGMDKLEMRRSQYGAWDFFQEQSRRADSVIDNDMREKIKKSMGNTVQTPVFNAEDVTISNVRACTVADSENTTALVTLVFATYSFGFTMFPAQHFNNQISYEVDWRKKMNKYLLKLAATLDTGAVNFLSTNKNQYFPAAISAYYPAVANALQVTQAQKNDFFNSAHAILNEMDFYGTTNVIASTSLRPMLDRLRAQGGGNATNESFQFNGYDYEFTNRMTNGAGVQSTGYLVADGVVGVENRNDPDTQMRSRIGDIKEWDEVQMPIVNLRMGSYYYADCADISALHAGTSNLTRSKKEGFEFSTDIVYVKSYNSAPASRYFPIVKFEVSAS